MRVLHSIVVGGTLVAGLLLAGCGSSEPERAPGSTVTTSSDGPGPLSSSGMVVPDTFLEFNGARYRLVEVIQADLVPAGEFRAVGQADRADIDYQPPLTVYSKGEEGTLYTFTPGSGSGEERLPPLWQRWRADS